MFITREHRDGPRTHLSRSRRRDEGGRGKSVYVRRGISNLYIFLRILRVKNITRHDTGYELKVTTSRGKC